MKGCHSGRMQLTQGSHLRPKSCLQGSALQFQQGSMTSAGLQTWPVTAAEHHMGCKVLLQVNAILAVRFELYFGLYTQHDCQLHKQFLGFVTSSQLLYLADFRLYHVLVC